MTIHTTEPLNTRKRRIRIGVIFFAVALIALGHWRTPVAPHWLHGMHILLRKSFLIPILLAAVWYNLRGALLAALAISFVFLPHVLIQWRGQVQENANQFGEFVTIWGSAVLAGWLVGKEKSALGKLSQTHEGALVALVRALDAREHNTQLHSLRVRAFAEHIAKGMGIDGDARMELARGALLHDIGKIGVPDSILLKKGPLTSGEWRIMRKHPEIGSRILESVPYTDEAALVVCAHHEKYDGTGYPRGLKGDEIPVGARIFAIVDAFDALTSDRPYQSAVTIAEAVETIRNDAGSHFDPNVVAVFVSVPEEKWRQIADSIETNDFDPTCEARLPGPIRRREVARLEESN
ncbi:MAG: HD domain-containing protein [Nitrospiraceae bacterium]|nr:HD domain-containing protein [Nitrospiraceae bacterium]